MESGGWWLPNFAALMVTAAETAGGVGLQLGLLTPLAACAVIAAMLDAWAVNVSAAAFWSAERDEPDPLHRARGVNLPGGKNCHHFPNRDSMIP
jgi:uncharacterized membrane protein YphA (DoxX/SURF4 family)